MIGSSRGSVNVYLPVAYLPHSLPLIRFVGGGASHCYAIGLSSDSIKLVGNWSSSCYLNYIENDFQTRFNIVSQMQKHV